MKYIKQFAIIAAITFLGEVLNLLLPFPVPASIYGMVMLFVCLMTGILKLSQIEETADLLLGVMPIFFISPTVSIMSSIGLIKDQLIGVFLTCVVSTAVVMAVTGWVAQFVMKHDKKEGEN